MTEDICTIKPGEKPPEEQKRKCDIPQTRGEESNKREPYKNIT